MEAGAPITILAGLHIGCFEPGLCTVVGGPDTTD
jgi:hypothetical protein